FLRKHCAKDAELVGEVVGGINARYRVFRLRVRALHIEANRSDSEILELLRVASRLSSLFFLRREKDGRNLVAVRAMDGITARDPAEIRHRAARGNSIGQILDERLDRA